LENPRSEIALRLQTETLPGVGFAGAFLTGRRIWVTLAPALRLGLGICRCGALGGLELGGQKLDDLPLKHALPKAWPPAARPATIRRSISMKLTSREGTVTN
jgi:hypothetical protein